MQDFISSIHESLLEVINRDQPAIFEKLIAIAKKYQGSAYLVGGAVRDEIIGQPSKDLDFMFTKIPLETLTKELQAAFPEAKLDEVGKSFGIIKMNISGEEYDIAIPRADTDRAVVKTDPNIPVEQDLLRRDTTMNALAKNLETGEIISPPGFDGVADIKNGVIRAVGNAVDRFSEDPLRMLRVISQASRFGFEIDSDTLQAIKKNVDLLKSVSGERFLDEFYKGLTKGKADKERFFSLLEQTGIGRLMFGPDFQPIITNKFKDDSADQAFSRQLVGAFLKGGDASKLTNKQDIMNIVHISRLLYSIYNKNGKLQDSDIRILSNQGQLFDFMQKTFQSISPNLGEWLQNWLSKPVIPKKSDSTSSYELPISGGELIELAKSVGKDIKGKAVGEMTNKLIHAYRDGEIVSNGDPKETIKNWMTGVLKESWVRDIEAIDILKARISNILYK